jgi:hypothetical protein
MKKIIKYMLIGLVATTMSSCKDFLNINNDPSVPQKVSANTLMAPIFAQMVRGEALDTRYIGLYTQMFAVSLTGDTWERHGYIPGSDAIGEKWRSNYWSIGKNIDLVIDDGLTTNSNDLVGAAKAIRAWSWQSSTDVYNEMILTQAWEPNRYSFDFDTQDKIYAEVVRLCNEALADMDKGGAPRLKLSDLIYQGDAAKWKKFIYGNLARNANHLSNKSTYKPDDVIKYCDLALAANTDNFKVPHAGLSSADANFFGPLRNNLSNYRASNTFTKLLDGTAFGGVIDPRLPLMVAPSPDSIYRGLQTFTADAGNVSPFTTKRIPNIWGAAPGSTSVALAANAGFTTAGRFIFKDAEPHYIMTAAEIQFIKAEAAFRKGDKATAFAAFKNGIGLHMDFCGVSAANKATFLASAAVKTEATLALSDIMQQKYIALWGHGALEAWADMRRFRYDPLVYTTFVMPTTSQYFPDNNGKLAYRCRPRYNSEYVWNRASLDIFGGNNADYHTYEPWFIKP